MARPKRALLRGGLIVLLAVILGGAGYVGYDAWSVHRGLSAVRRGFDLPQAPAAGVPGGAQTDSGSGRPANGSGTGSAGAPTTAVPATSGPGVNLVLIGSDSRTADAGDGRSDTLMVLHVDADRQHAYLISFPRDMWVAIPDHGTAKINAAYAWGGAPLTIQTLQSLLGVRMDHAAIIDFSGFADLTDAVGGVTIHNDLTFSSDGFTFPAGDITISGKQALAFVRNRYDQPKGDFDRAANQRKVVKALLAKIATPQVLGNPQTFAKIIGTLGQYVTVDNGFTDSDITQLALSMRTTPGNLVTMQAPVSGTGVAGGQDIDVVDTAKLHQLAAALADDTLAGYVARYGTSGGE